MAGRGRPLPGCDFCGRQRSDGPELETPLIPGINGSGALLARALTGNGFITLLYDKRASCPYTPENVKKMAGRISMEGHVAELAGGVNLLASREDVNNARIFVLANSEGCVHAINYQTQRKKTSLCRNGPDICIRPDRG